MGTKIAQGIEKVLDYYDNPVELRQIGCPIVRSIVFRLLSHGTISPLGCREGGLVWLIFKLDLLK